MINDPPGSGAFQWLLASTVCALPVARFSMSKAPGTARDQFNLYFGGKEKLPWDLRHFREVLKVGTIKRDPEIALMVNRVQDNASPKQPKTGICLGVRRHSG